MNDLIFQGTEDPTLLKLLERFPDALLLHDQAGRVVRANDRCRQWLQLPPDASLSGRSLDELLAPPPTPDPNAPALLADSLPVPRQLLLPQGNTTPVDTWTGPLRMADHTLYLTILTPPLGSTPPPPPAVGNLDPLTGLPNRALFLDRLTHELLHAERKKSHIGLMFIDLDHFKRVNDTLGHAAGDLLLMQAADRIQQYVRKSDTVARLGGDEFTVILPDVHQGTNVKRVAINILEALAKPFDLEGQEAYISGSIGITIYPDDGDTVTELLKHADSAMYKAKGEGRNAYSFFTPSMQMEALRRMALEKDLRRAVRNQEFVLHYQPILNLQTGRLVGAEAFLRWNKPEMGLISSAKFVDVAEEMGLIRELDAWTLATACRQAREWCERRNGDFLISVNLACRRCRDLGIDQKLETILRQTGLPPDALILEITENILMEDEKKALEMLANCKRMGVSLWLDDFGTGYSSLSFLKRLPVDGIKIDRLFVQDAPINSDSAILVNAMLNVAQNLALHVVGEGVETIEQSTFLRTRGCHLAQGYFFGRPTPPEEFERWLG